MILEGFLKILTFIWQFSSQDLIGRREGARKDEAKDCWSTKPKLSAIRHACLLTSKLNCTTGFYTGFWHANFWYDFELVSDPFLTWVLTVFIFIWVGSCAWSQYCIFSRNPVCLCDVELCTVWFRPLATGHIVLHVAENISQMYFGLNCLNFVEMRTLIIKAWSSSSLLTLLPCNCQHVLCFSVFSVIL